MSLQSTVSDKAKDSSVAAPKLNQLAALCWRKGDAGREVLLVSSSSGRWILPKGWPIDGLSSSEAAMVEAWEEAGVKRGKADRKPIGRFLAQKEVRKGVFMPASIKVYSVKVEKIVKDFPEADRRNRRWVSPQKAAKLVDETGLKDILRSF